MKFGNRKLNIILELISSIILLGCYILFVIQSFINIYFIKFKTKKIIAERLLYEQFSEEVYSNIKSHSFSKIDTIEDYNNSANYLNLEVKLNSFYDCQDEKNGLLNEKICQDKIVKNYTCCKSECCGNSNTTEEFICSNYSFDINQINLNNKILNYNEEEMIEDPRKICKYYNTFNVNTSRINNYYLQVENFEYNYEDLLLNENDLIKIGKESPSGYTDCGVLDTLKNHLYLKGISCPVNFMINIEGNLYFDNVSSNSLSIFVRNIISEIPPNVHEWRNEYVSIKYEGIDKDIKENRKKSLVTVKYINKLVDENKDYYQKQDTYFYINNLTGINDTNINFNQKFYWYTTNYIGFNSTDELKKFKEIFDENDYTQNALYKIRKDLFPSYPSAIIGIIFIIICLVYIVYILRIIIIKKKYAFREKKITIIKDIVLCFSFIVGLIIYSISISKFKSINIKMDENYKEVLNLYNKRRKQIYFMSGIIIMPFIIVFEIYYLFFAKKETEYNNVFDKRSSSSTDTYNTEKENRSKFPQEKDIKTSEREKVVSYNIKNNNNNIKNSSNHINIHNSRINHLDIIEKN